MPAYSVVTEQITYPFVCHNWVRQGFNPRPPRAFSEQEAERERILAHCDSITLQLKDEWLAREALDQPRDFQQRLEDILFQAAVIPSAQRGRLGDLQT